jgi:hypothetical protein
MGSLGLELQSGILQVFCESVHCLCLSSGHQGGKGGEKGMTCDEIKLAFPPKGKQGNLLVFLGARSAVVAIGGVARSLAVNVVVRRCFCFLAIRWDDRVSQQRQAERGTKRPQVETSISPSL